MRGVFGAGAVFGTVRLSLWRWSSSQDTDRSIDGEEVVQRRLEIPRVVLPHNFPRSSALAQQQPKLIGVAHVAGLDTRRNDLALNGQYDVFFK
jgi:hypothetical protein